MGRRSTDFLGRAALASRSSLATEAGVDAGSLVLSLESVKTGAKGHPSNSLRREEAGFDGF